MGEEIKVSVVVPVYNVEEYLPHCLESIIGQTLKDIEIICVDDGSTDSSLQILQKYKQKDSRIVVLTQKNLNAGAARNKGLSYAKGKYLSFLDSDDFFEKDMLERCYKQLEKDQSDMLVFSANQYNTQTKTTTYMSWSLRMEHCPSYSPFSPMDIQFYLFNSFQSWPWNKMFRKTFIQKNCIVFQEIARTNDMAFVYTALALASKISVIDRPFVYYRIGSGTNLQSTNDRSPLCFWDAYKETKNRLMNHNVYKKYEQSFLNSILDGTLYNLRSVKSWPAYRDIFLTIKDEAEKEFGFMLHPSDYFYNQNNYQELVKIEKYELSEYLYNLVVWLKKDNQIKQEITKTDGSSGHISNTPFHLIRKGLKCYQEHGLRYTYHQVLLKLKKNKEI